MRNDVTRAASFVPEPRSNETISPSRWRRASRPPDRRPRRRRALSLLSLPVVLLAALAGWLGWHLSRGPLDLGLLRPRLVAEVTARLPPGYRADLSGVGLALERGGLSVVLQGARLLDAAGTPLVSAPRTEVVFDPWAMLTIGFQPRSIVVDGATIRLDIPGSRPAPQNADEQGLSLPAITGALDAVLAAAGALDAVTLTRTRLVITERTIGRSLRYPDVSMTLRRTAVRGGVSLALDLGEGELDAKLTPDAQGGRMLDLTARNLSLADIVVALSPDQPPPDVAGLLGGEASLAIAVDGSVSAGHLALQAGAGHWTINPDVHPFAFDAANLALHWEPTEQVVSIDRLELRAGPGHALATGQARPPQDGEHGAWIIALKAPGMDLAGATAEIPRFRLDTAALDLRFDPTTHRIGLDRLALESPDIHVTAVGSFTFEGRSPGVGLAITAGPMPAAAVKSVWPFFVSPEARTWFIRNVSTGTLESGTLNLALPTSVLAVPHGTPPVLPDESVAGNFTLSNFEVKPIDTLPPISHASGEVVMTGRHLALTVDSATIETAPKTDLQLSKGRYAIRDLAESPAHQDISLHLGGDARAVADLMTRPPLAQVSRGAAPDPAGVTGQAELDVILGFPITGDLKPEQVTYAVLGRLNDVSIGSFAGAKLDGANLKLSILPGTVSVAGTGVMSGTPVTVSYSKPDQGRPDLGLTMTLDDKARARRGFDTGSRLTGPVAIKVRLQSGEDATAVYAVEVDLTAARIAELLPGWQKPAGRPAKASFAWHPGGGGGEVHGFALDSGSVSVHGDAVVGADNALRRAVLKTVRFSAGDDAQAVVDATDTGWRVSVRGHTLDVRPMLQSLQRRDPGGKPAPAGKGPDISADVQLDDALGFGDENLSNLAIVASVRNGAIQRLDADARLGTGSFSARRNSLAGASPQLRIEVGDAGAMLRFLNLYTKVRRGTLQAVISPTLASMGGVVSMRDFEVRNEPALGQVYSSLNAPRPGQDASDGPAGSGTRFSRLRLVFARTADQLSIQEGVVWGPQIGANVSGTVDYTSGRLGLTGVFVPAYAVNNLFSRIPLLGPLLGGDQHEGLFAISFKVAGSLDKPVLTVNPLSAIAPGFLRKLFEFQKG